MHTIILLPAKGGGGGPFFQKKKKKKNRKKDVGLLISQKQTFSINYGFVLTRSRHTSQTI